MTTDTIQTLIRALVKVRITNRRRSSRGFVVKVNGLIAHECPTVREAINHLIVRLKTARRLTMTVEPKRAQRKDRNQ